MGDSEQEPFSPIRGPEERRNLVPMAVGAAFVVVAIAVIVLLTRAGQSTANTAANDPTLAKVQLADLHMATAQNFAGNSVTYIEGRITNNSDRKITAAHVSVLFKNSIGETAQEEKALQLAVLLPNLPYVDYGPLDRAPLAPGQARDFRLTLEHISADWDGQTPQVRVVSVGY
ncbi:MAG TPA: DUF2393 family protein [Candidatus Angelobacter sp.]|nr:DUF2393 family protein [Candidatus Angelobacter sp.]